MAGRAKGVARPTTWNQYDGHVRNHIEPDIGGVKLTALDAAGVVGFVTRMSKKGTSAAMARKIVRTLRSALGAAVAADIIPKDPASKIPLPRHSRKPVRVLAPGEVRRLLDAANGDRLGPLISVAVDSGLRQGELFALTWADFDPASGALSVTKSLAELNGKLWIKVAKTDHGRRRVVLMFALPALKEHRDRMAAEGRDTGPKGLIFCNTKGGFLRKSNYHRKTFAPPEVGRPRRAEVPRTPARVGVPDAPGRSRCESGVESVGHGSAGFTMNTYQHVIVGMQEKAAAALAGILSGPIGYKQATDGAKNEGEGEKKNPPKSMP